MQVHGLRICLPSAEVADGQATAMVVHERLQHGGSDFHYLFQELAPTLRGRTVVTEFGVESDSGGLIDPMVGLRSQYGADLVVAHLETQTVALRGDGFERWSGSMEFVEGAFLLIFDEQPSVELLRKVWHSDFQLTSATWPPQMRALLHMWDDLYWQFFTVVRADIDALVRAHAGDPKLRMYLVDIDLDYPRSGPHRSLPEVVRPVDPSRG
jgi:hypothetical protein